MAGNTAVALRDEDESKQMKVIAIIEQVLKFIILTSVHAFRSNLINLFVLSISS